jgi:hypothetical protein
LAGGPLAHHFLYHSHYRDNCFIEELVGNPIKANIRRKRDNYDTARPQNTVDLVEAEIIGVQVLENSQANDVVETGVWERQLFGIRAA